MDHDEDIEGVMINAIDAVTRAKCIVEATVVSVDADPTDPESTYTAVLQIGEAKFNNVPLKILMGSQAAFIEVPEVDSIVLMGFRDGSMSRPQILMTQNTAQLLITAAKTIFGTGSNGGLVLVIPLTGALNAGQNDQNILKELIAGWTPVPGDGGASLKALLTAWCAQPLAVTTQEEIQSTTITQ